MLSIDEEVLASGFILSAALVVLIHELGHAAAQWLCGIPVREIVWGRGPRLLRLGVLEIRLVPLSGHVLPVGVLHARRRWQGVLIALAGVLATWVVFGVLIVLRAPHIEWLREFFWGWLFWSGVGLIQLLPIKYWDGWWALNALGILPRPGKGERRMSEVSGNDQWESRALSQGKGEIADHA